jgi:hypothetical protein
MRGAMPTSDELADIFVQAADRPADVHKDQLAYRHMIAVADHLEGWSMDPRTSLENTASLMGFAEALRRLANDVGEEWDPPMPKRLSLIGAIGRWVLNEPTPKRKPS